MAIPIAKKLKTYRAKHSITQAELAGLLGVSIRYVQQIESEVSTQPYKAFTDRFQELINADDRISKASTAMKSAISTHKSYSETQQLSRVFIVHGHDDLAKIEIARFIEKLGLEPVILHEKASSGQTIIEKIETYSNVGFGIVIYTPCDFGGKKGEEQSPSNRARQNVVFEHGYLIAKIGRNNVAALVKGNIEIPNDISGVVYIPMNSEEWKIGLAKELKNSGFKIDMNRIL